MHIFVNKKHYLDDIYVIKINIIANSLAQIYAVIMAIVTMPILLRFLGEEAVGLIGIYYVLQTILSVADLGLSANLGRNATLFRAGKLTSFELEIDKRSTQRILFAISIFIFLLIFISADYLSKAWLHSHSFNSTVTRYSIYWMGTIIALRLFAGIYRSMIAGFEHQIQLSLINSVVNTLKFPFVLLLLYLFDWGIVQYFEYQFVIVLLEIYLLGMFAFRLLPAHSVRNISGSLLKRKLVDSIGFAESILLITFEWIVLTNIDKIYLSHAIPLSQYGLYSVAISVSNGILLFNSSLSTAIMPRITNLVANAQITNMESLYLKTSGYVSVVVFSLSSTISVFSDVVLKVWTGDSELITYSTSILAVYASANGFIVLAGFPFFLQYAYGKFQVSIKFNIFLIFIMALLVVILFDRFGVIGVAFSWLIVSLISLFVGANYMHKLYLRKHMVDWFIFRILVPMSSAYLIAYLSRYMFHLESYSRIYAFFSLMAIYLLISGFTLVIYILSIKMLRTDCKL